MVNVRGAILTCHFLNEHCKAMPFSITFFDNEKIGKSSPLGVAYAKAEPGEIYLISGPVGFADRNFNSPLVRFFRIPASLIF